MFRSYSAIWPCIVAGGLFCLADKPAAAQSLEVDGVVRISDSQPVAGQPVPDAGLQSAPANYGTVCPPDYGSMYGGGPYGNGYGSGQLCGGFSPPVKRPIYRSPVIYQKNFPNAWTGAPAPPAPAYRLPSVYMPTDTTQLGYYYQVVPYWLPRANAVPPAPIPSEWHLLLSQTQHYGHPAGIVLGTAPIAVPSPAPTASVDGMIPPAPTPVEVMRGTEEANLKPADVPNLLPIN